MSQHEQTVKPINNISAVLPPELYRCSGLFNKLKLELETYLTPLQLKLDINNHRSALTYPLTL